MMRVDAPPFADVLRSHSPCHTQAEGYLGEGRIRSRLQACNPTVETEDSGAPCLGRPHPGYPG
jgi:hypothetical protein